MAVDGREARSVRQAAMEEEAAGSADVGQLTDAFRRFLAPPSQAQPNQPQPNHAANALAVLAALALPGKRERPVEAQEHRPLTPELTAHPLLHPNHHPSLSSSLVLAALCAFHWRPLRGVESVTAPSAGFAPHFARALSTRAVGRLLETDAHKRAFVCVVGAVCTQPGALFGALRDVVVECGAGGAVAEVGGWLECLVVAFVSDDALCAVARLATPTPTPTPVHGGGDGGGGGGNNAATRSSEAPESAVGAHCGFIGSLCDAVVRFVCDANNHQQEAPGTDAGRRDVVCGRAVIAAACLMRAAFALLLQPNTAPSPLAVQLARQWQASAAHLLTSLLPLASPALTSREVRLGLGHTTELLQQHPTGAEGSATDPATSAALGKSAFLCLMVGSRAVDASQAFHLPSLPPSPLFACPAATPSLLPAFCHPSPTAVACIANIVQQLSQRAFGWYGYVLLVAPSLAALHPALLSPPHVALISACPSLCAALCVGTALAPSHAVDHEAGVVRVLEALPAPVQETGRMAWFSVAPPRVVGMTAAEARAMVTTAFNSVHSDTDANGEQGAPRVAPPDCLACAFLMCPEDTLLRCVTLVASAPRLSATLATKIAAAPSVLVRCSLATCLRQWLVSRSFVATRHQLCAVSGLVAHVLALLPPSPVANTTLTSVVLDGVVSHLRWDVAHHAELVMALCLLSELVPLPSAGAPKRQCLSRRFAPALLPLLPALVLSLSQLLGHRDGLPLATLELAASASHATAHLLHALRETAEGASQVEVLATRLWNDLGSNGAALDVRVAALQVLSRVLGRQAVGDCTASLARVVKGLAGAQRLDAAFACCRVAQFGAFDFDWEALRPDARTGRSWGAVCASLWRCLANSSRDEQESVIQGLRRACATWFPNQHPDAARQCCELLAIATVGGCAEFGGGGGGGDDGVVGKVVGVVAVVGEFVEAHNNDGDLDKLVSAVRSQLPPALAPLFCREQRCLADVEEVE